MASKNGKRTSKRERLVASCRFSVGWFKAFNHSKRDYFLFAKVGLCSNPWKVSMQAGALNMFRAFLSGIVFWELSRSSAHGHMQATSIPHNGISIHTRAPSTSLTLARKVASVFHKILLLFYFSDLLSTKCLILLTFHSKPNKNTVKFSNLLLTPFSSRNSLSFKSDR